MVTYLYCNITLCNFSHVEAHGRNHIFTELTWLEKKKVKFSAYLIQIVYTVKYHKLFLTICLPTEGFIAKKS